jgi:hypothetical protein
MNLPLFLRPEIVPDTIFHHFSQGSLWLVSHSISEQQKTATDACTQVDHRSWAGSALKVTWQHSLA